MAMNTSDRIAIKNASHFLVDLGYSITLDDYAICYSSNDRIICITYPPNCDESDVTVRFKKANQVFSIGWIALVRKNIKGDKNKLKNVIELLNYLKESYDEVIQYNFCLDSNILIDEYVEKHSEEFNKTVNDFLKDQ